MDNKTTPKKIRNQIKYLDEHIIIQTDVFGDQKEIRYPEIMEVYYSEVSNFNWWIFSFFLIVSAVLGGVGYLFGGGIGFFIGVLFVVIIFWLVMSSEKKFEEVIIESTSNTYFFTVEKGKGVTHVEKIQNEISRFVKEKPLYDKRRNEELEQKIRDEMEKKRRIEEKKLKEVIRRKNLEINKKETISILDKNNDGTIDLIDGDSFGKILNSNQSKIIEIDRTYIQKFVKITHYLKNKKNNTQKIFESISEIDNDTELNELVSLLKNQVHTYELLIFHSINMVISLVKNDLITFYEIYECFDQLDVFNSNWENEVSNKLTDIGDGIKHLMYRIYQMENKIVNSVNNLTYVTQDSFKELQTSVTKELGSINSSIKFNNLLTGIQTYQMYRINQNTKRIG